MGRDTQTELLRLASLLLATSTLAACDRETTNVRYDHDDNGTIMAQPKKAEREKCYGVALAQYNNCAAGPTSDCAGTATKDNMPDRWKYVPAGSCAEQGGTLQPGKALDDE